ncbi:restriction endonuclease [Corticibacter populi]|uniref:Restriction endonuclease n=2 Tax=Corticibacter populi TaxID=1550736 RepID=A0A3M6QY23_9BURK|nr:restriction endonuclease [Corticibacter populi]RZS35165.1 restriction system protein [Corticibacter populi]
MLAAALAGLMAALIPREYAFFAIVGTFPIVLVGLIAAWRQLRTPSEERRAAILAEAERMSWPDFSRQLQERWRMLGIPATAPEHAGADWRIVDEGRITLVSARRWKAAVHGLEPMRQLAQAMQASETGHGLYIATGGEISPPAQRFAREHNIQIWQGDALALFLLGKKPLG